MLTVRRVRAAYHRLGYHPVSDVYLDESRRRCCPVTAVCLAEGRLRPRELTPPVAWRNVLAALEEPSPYVTAFLDAINRWHDPDWARRESPEHMRPAAGDDPALRLMRRGWQDGERVGVALFGPLPSRVVRRAGAAR